MAMIKNELAKFPELADYAKDLRGKGESYRGIQEALKKKGLMISHMAVKNYFDNVDALGASLIKRDQLLREEVKKDILNTNDQLKRANTILWDVIEKLKASDEIKDAYLLIKAIDSVTKQIDISSRIIGRMTGYGGQTHITQNISYLDFSIKVNNYLTKLEAQGFIKILKPIEMEGDIRG